MELDVKIVGEEIYVACEMALPADGTFSLAATLQIDEISASSRPVSYTEQAYDAPFMPTLRRYSLHGAAGQAVLLRYHGVLSGVFLFMEKRLHHFSLYNAWYPVCSNEAYDIMLHAEADMLLVHGIYDDAIQCWRYTTRGQTLQDPNILLMRRADVHTLENRIARFYYFDAKQAPYMQKILAETQTLYDFYLQLYGSDKMHFTDVVYLPPKYEYGAYKRDGLVVNSELYAYSDELHHLAHELAHAYGAGADTGTFEDWLNETTAEWSALLFEQATAPAAFARRMRALLANTDVPHTLRPCQDARPASVHESGVLLYYEIYQAYGGETVRYLLRTFDALPEKTTKAFVRQIAAAQPDVAAMIRTWL